MRTWFTAKATGNGAADIAIYDEIGGALGINSRDFRDSLTGLGDVKAINLRINSPGGDVFDGVAIHNMLARHPAAVNVTIDGIAASIASLIAMAGDTVTMPENAMMFVHNPFGFAMGDSGDMAEMADALGKIGQSMAATYARKTGKSPEDMLAVMAANTWMTATEAKEQGFADVIEAPAKIAARFDLSRYAPPASIKAAYDPDGDGDDDVLECLGYIGQAIDNLADAVGCLTGTGDPDGADSSSPAMAAMVAKIECGRTNLTVAKDIIAAPFAKPVPAETKSEPVKSIDAQEIASLCLIAGMPELTSDFLQSGKTGAEVRSELRALRADRGRGSNVPDVSARHAIAEPVDDGGRAGWSKVIGSINSRQGA